MSTDVSGGAALLSHWGVIRAEGADAASFLNGQLTSDIDSLGPDAARLAGYCTAKGRLLASFVVWRPADDVVLLACSADVLAATLKRLSMFVLRARCKLGDASASLALFGVVGAAGRNAFGGDASPWSRRTVDHATLIRLPDAGGEPRWIWCGATGTEPAGLTRMPVAVWDRLEVESGIARIVAATVEQFVPQMLNYEAVGGVDFQKGCYPGQEIVARSQYRGTIKRRTLRFDVEADALPGEEVFSAEDAAQPAGMVVNAAPAGASGARVLLVEVKLAAADGALRLRAPDGPPLRSAALPYALPVGQA